MTHQLSLPGHGPAPASNPPPSVTRPHRPATSPPPLRFTVDDAERAGDHWRFNCGPGALCALLSLTPDELRPHLGDFERRGYMSPTHMWDALHALRVQFWRSTAGLKERRRHPDSWPRFGLVRVQWGGPWCKDGVPIRVRYCYTHWVACCDVGLRVFDINAFTTRPNLGLWSDWWLTRDEWAEKLVPLLLKDIPRHDGTWWITHSAEVLL